MNPSPLRLPRTALCTAAFIFFASLAAAQSGSRLHVVSNRADVAGKFSSITDALTSATVADGDTLYVIGSPTSYGKITITKPVVIVGDGFGESNPNKPPTTLDSVNFAVSGSTISNCKLGDVTAYGTPEKLIESITLNRNDISGLIEIGDVAGWTIYHNVLRKTRFYRAGDNLYNMVIDHNIIYRTVLAGLQSGTVFITFNHFIMSRIESTSSAQIQNNIFFLPGEVEGFLAANVSENFFRNNVTNRTLVINKTTVSIFLRQNQGKDNLEGIELEFKKIDNPDALDFNFEDDYHLAYGSLAKREATDGTDPGIYGGSRPFPSWEAIGDLYPLRPSPSVLELKPTNSPVQRGDKLTLKVNLTPTPTKEN